MRLSAMVERMLALLGPELRSWIEVRSGHRQFFDPWGGPMNGQTARLEIVRSLLHAVRPARIIETGTYRGTTTEWLAGFNIPVVTIETDEHAYWFARRRLHRFTHVRVVHQTSVAWLEEAPEESAPVFCYLDAHTDGNLPLGDELRLIFARMPRAVVVIDDFAIPDDAGYRFGDYGPDAIVNVQYLERAELPRDVRLWVPGVPSSEETGHRRGAAIVTRDPQWVDVLAAMPLVRPWPLATMRGGTLRTV